MAPRIIKADDPLLWEAIRTAPANAVFVTPTDTVYGFSARLSQAGTAERIARLKGRPDTRFLVLVPDFAAAEQLAEISPAQEKILQQRWPGAISFVLKRRGNSNETIALRVPDSLFLVRLLQNCDDALLSTSCNRHGGETVHSVNEAVGLFAGTVDFYIDGGQLPPAAPSTLVDLTGVAPRVLRAGAVNFP